MSLVRSIIVLCGYMGWIIFPSVIFAVGYGIDLLVARLNRKRCMFFRISGLVVGVVCYVWFFWYSFIEMGFAHLFA